MKKSAWSQSGYTLMELMIVAAIIAIGASVAIPSFNTYVVRGRERMAQTDLIAVYTAEKNFFLLTFSYTQCVEALGFTPSSPSDNYYNVGFSGGLSATAVACGATATFQCNVFDFNGAAPLGGAGTPFVVSPCDCSGFIEAPGGGLSQYPLAHSACTFPPTVNVDPARIVVLPINWQITQGAPHAGANFLAGAIGKIKAGSANLDEWTMDDNKHMTHVTRGE